jgi:hypothetical protein
MKAPRAAALPALLVAASSLLPTAAVAEPIKDSVVFARIVGKWVGEGEFIDASDGSTSPVKETWTAAFSDERNFSVSGKRILDQSEHEFAWEFFANGDLIEGQMKASNPEIDLRLEAVVSEADGTVTIKVPLPGGGGLLTVVNVVSKDGTKIEGSFEIVDDSGRTTVSGKMVHTRP